MYKYFVSYFYGKKLDCGTGNCILDSSEKMNTEKIIREIEKDIIKRNKFKNAVILNFKLLEE